MLMLMQLAWTPWYKLYWHLWPSWVLVSRLSQSLTEAGRYAVHTVFRVDCNLSSSEDIAFQQAWRCMEQQIETVATSKVC